MTMDSYKTKFANLAPLREAHLNALIFNQEDNRSRKEKFLASQRLNDLSVTLQIARMNLKYSLDEMQPWSQYVFALNALLWYNACDDYICQYTYLVEHAEEITDQNYLDTLSQLKGRKLDKHKDEHKELTTLYKDLSKLHECVNIIKHRMPILDRKEQQTSIAFVDVVPDPNSIIGVQPLLESQLSTDVVKQESYTISQLFDILFNADNIITSFADIHIYSQFE